MSHKNEIQDLQLAYLTLAFLWGVLAVVLRGWQIEVSAVWIFAIACRGFGVEGSHPLTFRPNRGPQFGSLGAGDGSAFRLSMCGPQREIAVAPTHNRRTAVWAIRKICLLAQS